MQPHLLSPGSGTGPAAEVKGDRYTRSPGVGLLDDDLLELDLGERLAMRDANNRRRIDVRRNRQILTTVQEQRPR
jgi:hypothetical protein